MQAVGSRYIDWLVPGLLGMNIMGTGMWGVGFAIVQARSKKLLKRLVATPMSKVALPAVAGAEPPAVPRPRDGGHRRVRLGGVRRRACTGTLAALAVLALSGALAFGGLGLLLASRARTIEAVSGLMNLVMLPMWVLSGVFFASSNFPDVMQPFIRALPLTALNDGLRAVMNEGAGLAPPGARAGGARRVGRCVVRAVAAALPLAVTPPAVSCRAATSTSPAGSAAN